MKSRLSVTCEIRTSNFISLRLQGRLPPQDVVFTQADAKPLFDCMGKNLIMAMTTCTLDTKRNGMRTIARTLALIWACWWVFFALANAVGERFSQQAVLIIAFFPLIFLGSAIIPRLWERTGGAVLLLEGLIILFGYPWIAYNRLPLSAIIVVVLTLALPPLVAGFMFLVAGRQKSKMSEVSQESS